MESPVAFTRILGLVNCFGVSYEKIAIYIYLDNIFLVSLRRNYLEIVMTVKQRFI